jgi:hypothetical protein
MEEMPAPKSRLSDPEYAAFARNRYWRLMRWMLLAAILTVIAALAWLSSDGSTPSIAEYLATAAGVGLSVLLAGALMGLIFLSSGTGHDEDVAAFEPEEGNKKGRP